LETRLVPFYIINLIIKVSGYLLFGPQNDDYNLISVI